ncbi:hypothetical protein SESBI_06473 [Sesbania bispinosa]|nr:hypothetical protein SESBI_06473 [Sesbania bispinosa]
MVGSRSKKIKEWESKESGNKDHNKAIIREQKEQYGRKVYTTIVKECNDKQVESYLEGFLARNLVEPRLKNLDFFHSNGFEFQDLIEYQGLKHFVSIECKYLVELVKVFYCNMTIANEDLLSEVKNVKIRVRPSDWLTIAGLKYEGEKFDTTNICTWENYSRIEAV